MVDLQGPVVYVCYCTIAKNISCGRISHLTHLCWFCKKLASQSYGAKVQKIMRRCTKLGSCPSLKSCVSLGHRHTPCWTIVMAGTRRHARHLAAEFDNAIHQLNRQNWIDWIDHNWIESQLNRQSVCQSVGWLVDPWDQSGFLSAKTNRQSQPADRQTNRPTRRTDWIERSSYKPIDRPIDQPTDRPTSRLPV